MNMIMKLPYKFRDRWRRKSYHLLSTYGGVYYKNLVEFISDKTSVLKQPLSGRIDDSVSSSSKLEGTVRGKILATNSETIENRESPTKYCEYCKKYSHWLSSYKFFRDITKQNKSDYIKKIGLCFGWLRRGHISRDCTTKSQCSICSRSHPAILR